MGNSLPSNGYTHMGTNARILSRREDLYLEDGRWETWMVSYDIGLSSVELVLKKMYDKDGDAKYLAFKVMRPGFISFYINRHKRDLLNQIKINGHRGYEKKFVNETRNHWGGITKTDVLYHGSENEGNLLVVEQKCKSGLENPGAVTVAHYYAVSSQSLILRKKYDVALSIVVDIRLLNNGLDVSVKGPSQHPSFALLQMFQQVSRTWTWKWTACPHCAAETQRRQRIGVNGQQYEIEYDDEKRKWPNKIGGVIININNIGDIEGNNNGNAIFQNN